MNLTLQFSGIWFQWKYCYRDVIQSKNSQGSRDPLTWEGLNLIECWTLLFLVLALVWEDWAKWPSHSSSKVWCLLGWVLRALTPGKSSWWSLKLGSLEGWLRALPIILGWFSSYSIIVFISIIDFSCELLFNIIGYTGPSCHGFKGRFYKR